MVINYSFTNSGVLIDFDNSESAFLFKDKILFTRINHKEHTVKFVFSCDNEKSTVTATFKDQDSADEFFRNTLKMA